MPHESFLVGELARHAGELFQVTSVRGETRVVRSLATNTSEEVSCKALGKPNRLVWTREDESRVCYYQQAVPAGTHAEVLMWIPTPGGGEVQDLRTFHLSELSLLPFDQGELCLWPHLPDFLDIPWLVTKVLRKTGQPKSSVVCLREITPLYAPERNGTSPAPNKAYPQELVRIGEMTIETSQGDAGGKVHTYPLTRYLGCGSKTGLIVCGHGDTQVAEVDLYAADTRVIHAAAHPEQYADHSRETGLAYVNETKSGVDTALEANNAPRGVREAPAFNATRDGCFVTDPKSVPDRDFTRKAQSAPLGTLVLVRGPEDLVQARPTGAAPITGEIEVATYDQHGQTLDTWSTPASVLRLSEDLEHTEAWAFAWSREVIALLWEYARQGHETGKGPFKDLSEYELERLCIRRSFQTARVPGIHDFALYPSVQDRAPMVEVSFAARSQVNPARARLHSFREYDWFIEPVTPAVAKQAAKAIAREYVKNRTNPDAARRAANLAVPPPARRPPTAIGPLSDEEWDHAQRELELSQGALDSYPAYGRGQRRTHGHAQGQAYRSKEAEELGSSMKDFLRRHGQKVSCRRDFPTAEDSDYTTSLHNLRLPLGKTKELLQFVRTLLDPEPLKAVVSDDETWNEAVLPAVPADSQPVQP